MSLELLANELLYDIFDYFSPVDLFHGFKGLNCRFDQLLIEYFRIHKSMDFRFVFKEDLNLIRQRYLPSFISEITSLCLSDEDTNPHAIDSFISRLYPLYRFVNLQSITFYNIYSMDKMIRILTDLQRMPDLNTLNFYRCYFEYDPKKLLTTMNSIWSLSNLTHCCLELTDGCQYNLIVPTIISCSIQNLSFKGLKCGLETLARLYDQTPHLQSLSIEGCGSENESQSSSMFYLLTTLKFICGVSSTLLLSVLRKAPNLTSLTIESTQMKMNGQQWENVLGGYLPQLKEFNLQMKYQLIDSDHIEEEIDRTLQPYRTPFWIDQHKWFIRCFCTTENHTDWINIHTLPYRFENSILSITDNEHSIIKSTCPNNDHYFIYSHVQKLNYSSNISEDINVSEMQFPNLRHLTLTLPHDDYFRSCVPRLDKLISLSINMFAMGFDENELHQLQVLLDQAPHLYYLKFQSWSSLLTKSESKNKKSTNTNLWNNPPFALRSSSVRYLDLQGTTHNGVRQSYNENQSSSLIRSPSGSQCEFLLIEVDKRTTIIELVNKMKHLRALNVRCRERKSNDDDIIKWLQGRLQSTCTFAKDTRHREDIRLWIR